MKISTAPTIREIQELEVKSIDISNSDQVGLWHKLHQNSFSKHFGFAPRKLEKGRELVQDCATDPNGVFFAFKNGEPVGFCHRSGGMRKSPD
jgi:hypothetical protein